MCKVLYIDKEIEHGLFFKQVCEKKNVTCDAVFDYQSALEKIASNYYDAFITSLLLNNHNGMELIDLFPTKKWFVVTAIPEDKIPKKILADKRINRIMYKPITTKEILDIIDEEIKYKTVINE